MSDCTHVQFIAPTCNATPGHKPDTRRSRAHPAGMSDCTYVQRDIDYLESAEREYADAERWYAEACDDLNRAAAAIGAPGAP